MTTRRSFLRRALGSVLAAVAAVYCPGLGADDETAWIVGETTMRFFTREETERWFKDPPHRIVTLANMEFCNVATTVCDKPFLEVEWVPLTPAPSAENDR